MFKIKYPGIIPIVFIVISTTLLVTLGVWQLQRMQWKEALLNSISSAMEMPEITNFSGDVSYRKADLTGKYIEGKYLRFIGKQSNGYVYYVPLKLEQSEEVVLVNYGWFPANHEAEIKSGNVNVKGVLRPFRQKRLFSPENVTEKNIWFIENIDEIKSATGLNVVPYVLEQGKIPALRNDHFGYAITWFLLAIVGVVMFFVYFREK